MFFRIRTARVFLAQECRTAAISLRFAGDSIGYVDYRQGGTGWGNARPQGCFKSAGNGRPLQHRVRWCTRDWRSDYLPTACTSASTERETCHSGGLNTPSPPAPSADLLGVPVSRGALSQIGKRSLSSGSGRRHAWDSRPTGHYRNLLFFLCLGFAKVQLRSLLMDVRVRGRDTESMATARDHSTATVCGPQ